MAKAQLLSHPEQRAASLDRDWLTVFGCGICLVLSVGSLLVYVFGVFFRPLTSQFHWTRTQIATALVIGQFVVALSSPLWGFLVERFGPRRVILPSIAGMSLAFASLSLLTSHLWHLYLIFAVFSLLGGAASPVGYAAVLVRTFNRHLGLALGLALMGIGLGATVLPSLAQACVARLGWRFAYAAIGLLTLIVTIPAGLVATRNARLPLPTLQAEQVSVLPFLWTRAFLVMSAVLMLIAITVSGTFANLIPMLADRGNTPTEAARVAGFAGLAVIVGRGGIGWLLDRFNAARLLACVCVAVMVSLTLLLYAHGKLADAIAAFLLGSVLGAEVDFTAFLVRRYFGDTPFNRLYGIGFGLFALSGGIGPLLLGLSFDRTGDYRSGLLLFVGVSFVAALATFAMPQYKKPQVLNTGLQA